MGVVAAIVVLLLALAPAASAGQVAPDIVGGQTAPSGSFGFMAFLAHYVGGTPDFACSGTVLSSNVVLTAGHCGEDTSTGVPYQPSDYRVVTSALDWTDAATRQVSSVSRVIVEPAFNPGTLDADATLLVLSTPTTAPAIPLASYPEDSYLLNPGTGAEIAGWGATASQPLTAQLQWGQTVVQSLAPCAQQAALLGGPFDAGYELCAIDAPTFTDSTCNGDSGGPLLAQRYGGTWVEIGITSWGATTCSTAEPDFFTRADAVSSWAESWVAAEKPAPPPPPPAATTTPPPPAPTTTTPPSSAPATPQLPWMTFSDARTYTYNTLSDVLPRVFHHRYGYKASCTRRSAVRVSCNFGFRSAPNDYWGTVTSSYLFGANDSLEWVATYTIHWVNDQCYHSGHRSRCRGCPDRRGTLAAAFTCD
jgi:secreted trypsin-like serine protease